MFLWLGMRLEVCSVIWQSFRRKYRDLAPQLQKLQKWWYSGVHRKSMQKPNNAWQPVFSSRECVSLDLLAKPKALIVLKQLISTFPSHFQVSRSYLLVKLFNSSCLQKDTWNIGQGFQVSQQHRRDSVFLIRSSRDRPQPFYSNTPTSMNPSEKRTGTTSKIDTRSPSGRFTMYHAIAEVATLALVIRLWVMGYIHFEV